MLNWLVLVWSFILAWTDFREAFENAQRKKTHLVTHKPFISKSSKGKRDWQMRVHQRVVSFFAKLLCSRWMDPNKGKDTHASPLFASLFLWAHWMSCFYPYNTTAWAEPYMSLVTPTNALAKSRGLYITGNWGRFKVTMPGVYGFLWLNPAVWSHTKLNLAD